MILTVSEDDVTNLSYHPPWGKSHHIVLSFEVPGLGSSGMEATETSKVLKFNLNKGNYGQMKQELSNINWNEKLTDEMSVEDCWEVIERTIKHLKEKHIPLKTHLNQEAKRKSLVPKTILDKIRLKRQAFKMYKKYRTKENMEAYARARNQVKWALRKSVKEKETAIAKTIKTDPKSFYAYISSKTKPKENVTNLFKDDGTLTKTNKEKADVLNSFFCSVFTQENTNFMPSFDTFNMKENALSCFDITEEQVIKRLSQLNINKTEGPDGMHPRLLKELAKELGYPLMVLFNKSLKQGKIPTAWKNAEVKPIFKKGEKCIPGNYRPVSLTSVVCKVLEGFVRDVLNSHFKEHNLLSDHQYGFCSGRSCSTQLLTTIQDWMKLIEEGKPVDVIYLDLQKAFDKVPHRRLINKLQGYGISGKLLTWIEDFLTGRSQFVNVAGEYSANSRVTSGVPQGSVLGPTLFIYFINDMPNTVDSLIKIFADDTKIYEGLPATNQSPTLQKDIEKLHSWTLDWQIKFNSDKCKVLHLGKNNPDISYNMNGVRLEVTEAEKDLGVVVDNKLSFDQHISEIVKKGNKITGMISHYITNKTKEIMIPLYKSLVRPIMEYGNVVWSPWLRKDIDKIEGVQRRFTKRICDVKEEEYETRLKILRLPSLEYRRARGDMIETYKIVHKLYDPNTTSSLFTINDSFCTRGHPFKLTKISCKTSMYQHFFTNRIINHWNNLPHSIIMAGTLNSFKNLLDKHWEQYMFLTNIKIV